MDGLEPLAHPKLFGRVGDVHVLDAERAAVGLLQRRHDVAQGGLAALEELRGTRAEHRVEVGFGEVVVGEVQFRRRFPFPHAERVQRCPQVAAPTIGDDEFKHLNLLALVLCADGCRHPFRLRPQAVAAKPLEVLDDGAVGHVPDDAVHHRQAVEILPPCLGDAIRIVEVVLVEHLHVGGVAAGHMGTALHAFDEGLRHLALLLERRLGGDGALQVASVRSMERILPMARVGLRPLGQALTQFMMPRQRNTLNGSSSSARRSVVAVSRLSARKR